MKDVFDGTCRCKCSFDDPDCHEEGETIEKSPQQTYRDLKFNIMRSFMRLHIVWERRINCPPIASDIQENEKEEEKRKKECNAKAGHSYKDGKWWIQDFAAQIPVILMGDIRGKRILDLCASPGGKTAQMLSEGAIVTALDISKERIKLLSKNIQRVGLSKNLKLVDDFYL